MSDFYIHKSGKCAGRPFARCVSCERSVARERHSRRHPGGVTYDRETGRLWRQEGRGRRIEWTGRMLSDLRRLFARTKNEELAGILGVGVRTMVRKARELGLEKDGEWLSGMWRDHVRMAHMMSRALGYPGRIMPGEHRNPDGEFKKGCAQPEAVRVKSLESRKRYAMSHKSEYRRRGLKAWATRMAKTRIEDAGLD